METIAAMAAKYVPLIAAAGLLTEDMTEFDVYMLSGSLIGDPLVYERAFSLGFEAGTCIMAATLDDYEEIIQNMTPAEKLELRQRIGR